MHPNLPALRRYLLGDLPPGEADSIERHMAGCPTCEETIHAAGLEQTVDSLVEKLRTKSEALPFDRESELQEMLEKVRGLGNQPHGEASASVAPSHHDDEQDAIAPGSLGEYDLGEVLGSGGMGTVYQAVHRRLRRRVAIKLLRADRMKDRAALDRFEREMEAVGRLEHPNIVRALDAGEANGTLYLAMEYVDGTSISALAGSRDRLPPAEACEIVRQAAIGLAAAHRSGLVHRDVKPGNMMLARTASHTDDGTSTTIVKVLDLGLARIQGDASPGAAELTSADQVMGTVDYMAPEQAESSRDVGPATDVYALGATLYRLLAGVSPLGLDPAAGLIQKLAALVANEPTPLETRRPDLPRPLCAIVRRTLARDPAARPSAGDLAKALQPFAVGADLTTLLDGTTSDAIVDAPLTDATVSLRPLGSGAASVSGFATSHAIPAPAKSGASGGRNRTYVSIGLAAASLFAAVVAGVMIFRIATDRGTLVVEIADPAIEARLVAEGLKIVDTESGRDYSVRVAPAGKEASNPQASGEYDAVAPTGTILRVVGSDGLELETNQFKLVRGATVRIKVYAEETIAAAPAAQATMPASDPSASARLPAVDDGPGWLALANDRHVAKDFDGAIDAATKALSTSLQDRSAALRTRAYAYATRRILAESLADLDLLVSRDANDAEALRLRSLVHRELGEVQKADADAAAAAAIDPTQAELLRELPPASLSPNQELLAWIAAHGGGFGDGKSNYQSGFTSVTFDPPAFDFVALGEDVDDETVELLRRTTRIEKLQLAWETRISDAGFARLCSAPSLSGLAELDVNVPRVTAEGWKRIASLKRLRSLNVQFHTIPPIPEALVELDALETLSLHGTSGWSADEVAKLRDLPSTLRNFRMGGPNVAGEPLLGIVANRPLRELSLELTNVSDADIAALAATETRKTLEKLGVASRVGDGLADSIRQFPKLQVLELNGAALTPEGFANLGEVPALRLVNLHGTAIPREAVDAFREKNPRCTILSYHLGGIPSLEEERAAAVEPAAP